MAMTKVQVIRLLRQLEGMPDDLWLFVASGGLHLMKKRDGKKVYNEYQGVDPDYIIESFPGIECDGGDW